MINLEKHSDAALIGRILISVFLVFGYGKANRLRRYCELHGFTGTSGPCVSDCACHPH